MAGEEQAADKEKAFKEACLAVRTGISASENGNFKVAEPLLLRALDDFELCGVTDSKEYFQCLLYLADAYFHMDRFIEAKGYYEQLSVARLKHPESTDAQVVVALLKLAATQEKLGQIDDAVSTYDLTLELAQTTINKGHALYGVIFDAFEVLVERYIDEPELREQRLADLKSKRQQYGFTETLSGHFSALPAVVSQESSQESSQDDSQADPGAAMLAQSAEELRSTLSPWTHPELKDYAAELRARRDSLEFDGPLPGEDRQSHGEIAQVSGSTEPKVHAHLTPDMFRPKRVQPLEELAPTEDEEVVEGRTSSKISHLDEQAVRQLKRVKTDHKRFNPLPALTVIAVLSAIGGAVYLAREYAQNMVAVNTPVVAKDGLDLGGKVFASADGHKVIRFTTAAACEYSSGGTTAAGTYHLQNGDSPVAGFFGGNAKKMVLKETTASYLGSDGVIYYADTSKERQILTKVQAVANFANYFFASHNHVYPASVDDNQFGGTTFVWENPLTGSQNPPIIDSKTCNSNSFEETFAGAVRDFRDLKAHFAVDDAEHPPAGLIECIALVPETPPEKGKDTSALIIRAYDSEGKLIRSANPQKAYVVALKNGVSVDPIKASRDSGPAEAAAETYSFEIVPLPKPAAPADQAGAK